MALATVKNTCSRERFALDWSALYTRIGYDPTTEPINSSSWTITGSVTLGADFVDGAVTSIFLEGGTAGESVVLENIIEINSGEYRDCAKIFINVK